MFAKDPTEYEFVPPIHLLSLGLSSDSYPPPQALEEMHGLFGYEALLASVHQEGMVKFGFYNHWEAFPLE